MKLRLLIFALGLLAVAGEAHAQVGVYFNPLLTRVSISTPDAGIYSFLGQGDTSRIFGGVSMGGDYVFVRDPKFSVAFDVRDELEHGDSALMNSFLVGLHVAGRPAERVQPYLQISAGDGTTHSPLSPLRLSRTMFKAYAGGDVRVNPHLTFRALEVGYGSVTTISSETYGGSIHIPAANLVSVSSGLIFRFGGGPHVGKGRGSASAL
jgi:hypothetical protein